MLDLDNSLGSVEAQNEEDLSDPNAGGTSFLQNTAAKAAGVGSRLANAVAGPSEIVSAVREKVPFLESPTRQRNVQADPAPRTHVSDEVDQLEETMKKGSAVDEDDAATEPVLSARSAAERRRIQAEMDGEVARQEARQLDQSYAGRSASFSPADGKPPELSKSLNDASTSAAILSPPPLLRTRTIVGTGNDLMLDMSGYKVEEEDSHKAKAVESSLLERELSQGVDRPGM